MTIAQLSLPRLQQLSNVVDSNGQPSSSFHIWWDNFAGSIEKSFNNLADQVSDDVLTPDKKSVWITLYNTIIAEQSVIDAQAVAYNVTTEKSNYDTAITTLTTYLSTLTTPVAWNDVSGNTDITGTTFRGDFQNVLTAKQILLTKIDNSAGNFSITVNPPPLLNIHADSTGIIKSGELPTTLPVSADSGLNNITTLGTWSVGIINGVTCTIGANTGVLSLTAITVTEAYIPITFTYAGATRYTTVHVLVLSDPPTNTGTSGTSGSSASTTTLGNTTGVAYDTVNAVSAVLNATAGSIGHVDLAASVSYKSTDGTSTVTATGKWQYYNGTTWVDVGTEVTGTSNDYVIINESTGSTKESPGSVKVSATETGLTSGTSYQFRFIWHDAGSNCRATSLSLTAVGS